MLTEKALYGLIGLTVAFTGLNSICQAALNGLACLKFSFCEIPRGSATWYESAEQMLLVAERLRTS